MPSLNLSGVNFGCDMGAEPTAEVILTSTIAALAMYSILGRAVRRSFQYARASSKHDIELVAGSVSAWCVPLFSSL
jgi:hypothetical protein